MFNDMEYGSRSEIDMCPPAQTSYAFFMRSFW